MRPALPALTRSPLGPIAESARVAAAMRVVSGLVAMLAFAVPLAVTGVTGLNIEGQAAILAAVDSAGARTITIVSAAQGPVLPSTAVDRIASLSGVVWVVGLGPVSDVRNGLGVGPAPLRAIRAIRAPLRFGTRTTSGEAPGVFVSQTSASRLGLAGAHGAIDPGAITVVGWFQAADPLGALDAFVLLPSHDDALLLDRIIVSVDDVGWVDLTTANIRALVGAEAAAQSAIAGSAELLAARAAVSDEIVRRDRQLVLVLLGAAMILACFVVFAGAIAGRRDFGRRRALGATRGQLTMLVMLGTLWPALAGAAAGVLAGWAYLGSQLGRVADPRFPVAVGVLVVLALTLASALPAAYAATRDPLRVLRVP